MARFTMNTTIKTDTPTIEFEIDPQKPLPVGRHRFQLIVEDDSNNLSTPDTIDVIVRDTTNPTAILEVVEPVSESGDSYTVSHGANFTLTGERSSDVAPGKVASYQWRMIRIPGLVTPTPPIIRIP